MFTPALAETAAQPASATKLQIQSNYGKLPLSFEPNQGQTDSQVQFFARGRGYALFLTPTEAVLSLAKVQAEAGDQAPAAAATQAEAGRAVIRMQLAGANPATRVSGKDKLPGRVSYFRGNDPARWQTQIPTYAKVAYEGIYPGVDLVYYGSQGQLEYDFVVAPGADPEAIKLSFRGADRIEISDAGELVLHSTAGEIRMHAPVIYQETAGARTTVVGGYVLNDLQEASFEVAAYDTSRTLVIDPVLVYSTYLGGSGDDGGNAISVDRDGNEYVTGNTTSADFPTHDALQPTFGGGFYADVFVAKIDRHSGRLIYSTYLGGIGEDRGFGIAVDGTGNAYVTGDTTSTNFPTVNAVQPAYAGGAQSVGDAFVTKLNRDGDRLLYSTYLGGSGSDGASGISVDNQGRAHVTGYTGSADFPTVKALQSALRGYNDAFVAKLHRDGSRLLYSTYLGGSDIDAASGIAIGNDGNAYVSGYSWSTDFPTVKALQSALRGESDAFVAKFDRDGDRLLYSTYLGGREYDRAAGIAIDNQGNAYVTGDVTGYLVSPDFPTVNAVQPAFGGYVDAFLTKVNRSGDRLIYSTYLGGTGGEAGLGITLDSQGNVYLTGTTSSANFPTVNAVQSDFRGNGDVFVTELNRGGNRLIYSTYLGGNDYEFGQGIAVDKKGNAYVVGVTYSANFPTINALQSALRGYDDAFVAKLSGSHCVR
jgi:hypothetical protein